MQPRQRHRSWPRISVRWEARWALGAGSPQLAMLYDISAEGAFLRPQLGARLPVGETLSLRLQSPDQRIDLQTQATIRWAGRSLAHGCDGYGVQFETISEEIDRYIREHS